MEIWKKIDEFGGFYYVSNLGNIKSIDREVTRVFKNKTPYTFTHKGRYWNSEKYIVDEGGYYNITLSHNRKSKTFKVHRLVAKYFCEGYFDCAVVNHIDGNTKNNRAENLEWCTQKENDSHARRTGLTNPRAKCKPLIDKLGNEYWGQKDVANKLGLSTSSVSEHLRGDCVIKKMKELEIRYK